MRNRWLRLAKLLPRTHSNFNHHQQIMAYKDRAVFTVICVTISYVAAYEVVMLWQLVSYLHSGSRVGQIIQDDTSTEEL